MNKKIIYILSLVFLASNIIGSAEAKKTKKETQQFEGEYSYVESVDGNDVATTAKKKTSKKKTSKKKTTKKKASKKKREPGEYTPKEIYNQLVSKFNKIKNDLREDKKKVRTKNSEESTDQLKLKRCYKKISRDCMHFYKEYKADSRKNKKKKLTNSLIKTRLENLHTAVNGHRNSGILNALRNSTDAKVKAAAENAYNQLSTLATEIETTIQNKFSGQQNNL